MPVPPRLPISQVEQVSPAAPMSWMPTMAPVCMASRQASSSSFSRNGSPTCTLGRFCFGLLGELGRRHRRAVDAVAAGLRADVDHRIADAGRLAEEDLVVLGTRRARRRSPADCRCSTARRRTRRRRWARRSSCRSARCRRPRLRGCGGCARRSAGSSSGPKRSESITAMGRAPMVKMSRRMPPTPVAAPWNGSMKLGWLCDSILKAIA